MTAMALQPRGNDHGQPLTWARLIAKFGKERRVSATITCSKGHHLTLLDYRIGAEGSVEPPVTCRVSGCGFSERVRLVGWTA